MLTNEQLFAASEAQGLALTFDDLTIVPRYSEVLPKDASLQTKFSRNVPGAFVSAAMGDITESKMAICMAMNGGLGIIWNMPDPAEQRAQVRRVKTFLGGIVADPVCVKPDQTITEIENMRELKGYQFHSFPVVSSDKKLEGLITHHDIDINGGANRKAAEIMTPFTDLTTAPPGTDLATAHKILMEVRKKVLLLVSPNRELKGMYVLSDILRQIGVTPSAFNVDANGHLRVGVAVGAPDPEFRDAELMRVQEDKGAGADVVVLDSAHGCTKNVIETANEIIRNCPGLDVVVGNVSDGEAARIIVERTKGAIAGLKVGQGPGSICTTRLVAGVGVPQASAVFGCAQALKGTGIPICADGGLKNSGDIVKAFACGAHSVMFGGLLAGLQETPGLVIETPQGPSKRYRGMGSSGAMQENQASRVRYRQSGGTSKRAAEGVEKQVPFRDISAEAVLQELAAGVRSGMGYVGAATIEELHRKARFMRITPAGRAEGLPHGVDMGQPQK